MTNYVDKLFVFFGCYELFLEPLKMMARVCGILQKHPILVITSLCIERDDFEIELFEKNTEIAKLLQSLFRCLPNPLSPGFSNTLIQFNRIPLAPFIDINRIALMISK